MKIKTSELTGATLDWAVAIALGYTHDAEDKSAFYPPSSDVPISISKQGAVEGFGFRPSTDWSQGGPIIERERICVNAYVTPPGAGWNACIYPSGTRKFHLNGPTPLIAAMRCYVASKLGNEVEIPEELR